MAAKRKSRLSGTPEEHRRRGEYWVKVSREHSGDAIRSAQKSQCKIALRNLLLSNEELAKSQDNAYDAHITDYGDNEAINSFIAAEKAFKKNCLVGGGLSGTRRKSRR